MFGFRREAGIALALTAAVTLALLFGSVAHALLPHSHDGGEAIWQELHAAVRHEKAVVFFITVASALVFPLLILAETLPALQSQEADTLLRRGVHKYRKFR